MFYLMRPSKAAKAILQNIELSPEQWRVENGKYFYNRQKKMVFWIYCGRFQFGELAGMHMETRNYWSVALSFYDRSCIWKAYRKWSGEFAAMNIAQKLPHIELIIKDEDR